MEKYETSFSLGVALTAVCLTKPSKDSMSTRKDSIESYFTEYSWYRNV